MKKVNLLGITIVIVLIAVAFISIGYYLIQNQPVLIQGTAECSSYKASSKVPGRIAELKIEEGDVVAKGDILYTLTTPELDAKLEQAKAVHSAAQAIDAKAIAGARKQQIEAAMNMWQKAQTGLSLAKKTLDRVQNLYKEGVIPAQKLDEAQANYDAMLATEKAASSQYDMAVEGARKEEKAAATAQVNQAQGAVNEVQSYLNEATIYSPIDGEIGSVICEEGELVGTGYPVATILDLDDIWITFNIKEDMMPKITIGKHILAHFPALDIDVDLVVSHIAVQADFATWNATRTRGGFDIRTFAVKMRPTEKVENLRPGMSAIVNWTELE